ncbi:aldo/keto reductase [Streptosporangium subroseum]|uniref:aldo/keto reductase n=1 Tax=Streptosporangium subroseum TaxID=106412 RepID=UPI003092FD01|nr:aldo/keto reductase [Streptosporangium subroseum]
MTVSLGWGTYRVEEIGPAADAVIAAGCTWIDTAPNYLGGHAHGGLAPVLRQHPEVQVSTKAGYLTKATATAGLQAGVLSYEEADAAHSLNPDYLRWQIARNRTELGRNRLNLMFLHNPEHATGDPARLRARLVDAFAVLEQAARDGEICGYGVATWHGFQGSFTVDDLYAVALQVADGRPHHLHAIQLPVNLVQISPIVEALNGRGPLVEAAVRELAVFASAPLAGGELPGMITPELAALIRPGLTRAQASLAVVAATPGINRVLLSTRQTAHWEQAQAVLAAEPLDELTLRKIVDVLI